MIGLCIEVGPNGALLSIDGEQPELGFKYSLEPAASGSAAQNRAFHALVQEYWRSRAHSYNASNFDEFRGHDKEVFGSWLRAFVYAEILEGKPIIKDAKLFSDIPENVRQDPDLKQLVRGRLKSWSDYTKKERRETLDRLISEMHEAGVQSKKFHEILEGMQDNLDLAVEVFGGLEVKR